MKKLADENEELTWSRDSLKVQLNTQTQARERLKAELAKEKEKNSDKKVLDLEAQIKILVESNAEVKCDLVKTKDEVRYLFEQGNDFRQRETERVGLPTREEPRRRFES
jgi:chromosome segregation ATPase